MQTSPMTRLFPLVRRLSTSQPLHISRATPGERKVRLSEVLLSGHDESTVVSGTIQ